jgi:putative transposase
VTPPAIQTQLVSAVPIGGKVARRFTAFIESFNGRLRDELLNETLFTSLTQARVALRCWRADYNDARPHSRLGWQTPSEFAITCHPRRDLALRNAKGSAPAPVATTAQPDKSRSWGELRSG